MQLAQPFLDQPPLPVSQNFCSWLPYETLKGNYLRLACTLDKIHQLAVAIGLRCGTMGVFNEMEMESVTKWQQKVLQELINDSGRYIPSVSMNSLR